MRQRSATTSVLALVALVACSCAAARPMVLLDESRGARAGNADWTLTGAYSSLGDLIRLEGMDVTAHTTGEVTSDVLEGVSVLILPEPNRPFSDGESTCIRDWVAGGGGLFMIGDHAGSDRDGDGWDSVDVLTRLGAPLGLVFAHRWLDEQPLRGPVDEGPLTAWVRHMAAWGGTTLGRTRLNGAGGGLRSGFGGPGGGGLVLAGALHGRGRVVALGDSSPFDDGTGDPAKKLHESFGSFLYDIPQMASNCVRWLAGLPPRRLPPPAGVHLLSREAPPTGRPLVLLDAAHFNDAADKLGRFARGAEALGAAVWYADLPLDEAPLDRTALVVVDHPALGLAPAELEALAGFVRRGGALLLTARGAARGRGGQSPLNDLLAAVGSRLRFRADQVHDDERNYGRPWSLVAQDFSPRHAAHQGVSRILFWNPCSVTWSDGGAEPPPGVGVMGRSGPASRRVDETGTPVEGGGGFVLMAEERVGAGRVVALGTCPFTEYQYTEERRLEGVRDAVGVDKHETPLYNRRLVEWLLTSRD